MAKLTVEEDCIALTPLWPWRLLLRMPALRIPLSTIEAVSRIRWGIRFDVPGNATLDGTRFRRWLGGDEQLEALIEFLEHRGITVQTMCRSERIKGFLRDYAVAQRPGWIWRDRGWLGFIESAIALAVVLTVVFLSGLFTDLPKVMLAWLAFIVAVIVWSGRHCVELVRRTSPARQSHSLAEQARYAREM